MSEPNVAGIDWNNEQSVVMATCPEGYFMFADSIGRVWLMSKSTGAQGLYGESWDDARANREAVRAFEAKYNPHYPINECQGCKDAVAIPEGIHIHTCGDNPALQKAEGAATHLCETCPHPIHSGACLAASCHCTRFPELRPGSEEGKRWIASKQTGNPKAPQPSPEAGKEHPCEHCHLGPLGHYREDGEAMLRCLPGRTGEHRGKFYKPDANPSLPLSGSKLPEYDGPDCLTISSQFSDPLGKDAETAVAREWAKCRERQLLSTLDQLAAALKRVEELEAERDHPETEDFFKGVPLEAAHQRSRWDPEHDSGKTPQDWFWLIGYLAGKCLAAHLSGNTEKALHHTISTAAACANWHLAIKGKTDMRPGIETPVEVVETRSAQKAENGGAE